MASGINLVIVLLIAFASSQAIVATDPTQLQDFCVADNTSNVFVNGFVCKNPSLVTENDFLFRGFNQPGNTSNQLGSLVTPVFVEQLPGLNTLGISSARVDFAPLGLNAPHYHPRGSEMLLVLEGTLSVGFVTSNPDHKLFAKVLNTGDIYVFPQGLIHFQLNTDTRRHAVAHVSLSSQDPGIITVAEAVFGSKPPISSFILAKAFQIDEKTAQQILAKFSG